MKLSIITINYNNAEGLRKTLASVASQTYRDIEHIIVDGGSTDGSVDVIKEYENTIKQSVTIDQSTIQVKWLSEPDHGIYNAMNKGIEIALGRRIVNSFNRSEFVEDKNHGIEIALGRRVVNLDHTLNITHQTSQESLCDYVQILNSGDILASPDVTERMMAALHNTSNITHNTSVENRAAIFYGNMIKKDYTTGKIIGKSGEVEYSLRQYFSSTMNHDCCYIRRDVYEKYGLYDENLKIVSDWKWFLQAIGLGNVKPVYVDIDVTIFDAGGISESNLTLRNQERRQVLEELLPPAILADYDAHAFEIEQVNRLRRRHLYGLVYFIERVLFKLEKWHII
jgi:glycosyltransferase involved in cell wall biosynthesis